MPELFFAPACHWKSIRPGYFSLTWTWTGWSNWFFSGLLGACVMYTSDKSKKNLDLTISTLDDYLARISI